MTAFSSELKKAMKARGMGNSQLRAATGIPLGTIKHAITGAHLPLQDTVIRMADALTWPNLATIAARSRTVTCILCGTEFVRTKGSERTRFCSSICARTAWARRQREAQGRKRESRTLGDLRLTRNRLEAHRRAIAAFCADCTAGEMVCRDDGCLLRPVSPIAFVPLTAVSRRRVA